MQRDDDEVKLKEYKKTLESAWYTNSTKINTYMKKLQHAENQISDLEQTVKDSDMRAKDMEQGLTAQFEAREADMAEKMAKKEKELAKAVAGEKQKEGWDKEEVVEAKGKAQEENAVMAQAVKANKDLEEGQKTAQTNLDILKKKEQIEVKSAEEKVSSLELTTDLEKVNEDMANKKVSSSKADAERIATEAQKLAAEKVANAKAELAHQVAKMKTKIQKMEDKFRESQQLAEANEKARIAKAQAAADKVVDSVDERNRAIQGQSQMAEEKLSNEDEKLKYMKEELERTKAQMKEMEIAQAKEEERFKLQAKKDADRIAARAGVRTVAAEEKKEAETAQTSLATKSAELEKAANRVKELSGHKDDLVKKTTKLQQKLEHAEYKVFLEKKKSADLEMKLKKTQVTAEMNDKTAKHDAELGEAKEDKSQHMEVQYKYEVKAAEALKQQIAMEQAKNALHFSKGQKWEAKAQKYKQAMYAAEAHARRIATRVRKKWAMKLIKEQDAHTKALLKLKHFVSMRQAKHDAEILKIQAQKSSAQNKAEKAEAAGANQEEVFKYVAGMLGDQAVKGKVLRDYMMHMGKIRKKFNKNMGKEWKAEIKKLKQELDKYKNGQAMAKEKLKVMELQHEVKEEKKQQVVKMEVKRSQELDIQTLLAAAIKEASKGSESRSPEENRKRVDAAIDAVTKTVNAADDQKGKALARSADAALEREESSNPEGMQAKIKALEKENAELRKKAGLPSASEEADDAADHEEKERPNHEIGPSMTPKQKRLMSQLDSLVKMSSLPTKNLKVETDVEDKPREDIPKPPADDAADPEVPASQNSEEKMGEAIEVGPGGPPDPQVGELEKGAFLMASPLRK